MDMDARQSQDSVRYCTSTVLYSPISASRTVQYGGGVSLLVALLVITRINSAGALLAFRLLSDIFPQIVVSISTVR